MNRQIKIGKEFFAKAKNDYANWRWALVREFLQNSIDAGSTEIDVVTAYYPDTDQTHLVVKDNGCGMTEDVLVNKLLSLGSSGKDFKAGAVGGFGKAKEILYFCWDYYSIQTGDTIVEGAGAEYKLAKLTKPITGTTSQIKISGKCDQMLDLMFRRFIKMTQWGGSFVINGMEIKQRLAKGSNRGELEGLGTLYTNNSYPNMMIVRIGGVPMFHSSISPKKCVVLELDGTSVDSLNSNRDSLKWQKSQVLNNFITSLATDGTKALRSRKIRYTRFEGTKVNTGVPITATDIAGLATGEKSFGAAADTVSMDKVASRDLEYANQLGTEFVVKNETEMEVPVFWTPSGKMGSHQMKLARFWARLMIQMHRVMENPAQFGVGFVFTADAEAQYEKGPYGVMYYLNPAKVKDGSNGGYTFGKRFKLTERHRLISLAVHEYVHGEGYSGHDEEYAARLTDVFAIVMANLKTFNWCFG